MRKINEIEINGILYDIQDKSAVGIVVPVEVHNWVAQEDGTYTNTIDVEDISANEILDVSLYGDVTEEQAEVFDFLISSIDSLDRQIILTASEEIDVAFSIILRGRTDLTEKSVYVNEVTASSTPYDNTKSQLKAGDVQNAIDELAIPINGLIVTVSTSDWTLQEDGLYKKIIPIEQLTGNETVDVCLYPGDNHTAVQASEFSEIITSIEIEEGMLVLTALAKTTESFRVLLYGKINLDEDNLVMLAPQDSVDKLNKEIACKWKLLSDGSTKTIVDSNSFSTPPIVKYIIPREGGDLTISLNDFENNIFDIQGINWQANSVDAGKEVITRINKNYSLSFSYNVLVYLLEDSSYSYLSGDLNNLSIDKVSKDKITLGVHTDGLLYVFIDGEPVGTGVAITN